MPGFLNCRPAAQIAVFHTARLIGCLLISPLRRSHGHTIRLHLLEHFCDFASRSWVGLVELPEEGVVAGLHTLLFQSLIERGRNQTIGENLARRELI